MCDHKKTAVTGEDDARHIVLNRSLLALAKHFRFQPALVPIPTKPPGIYEMMPPNDPRIMPLTVTE